MTAHTTGADAYGEKSDRYFGGVREDILAGIAECRGLRIVEIGCGDGSTGRAAIERQIASEYFGVELFPEAGARAAGVLTEVVVGDIERAELPWPESSVDVVIASEVLEHLGDPWRVVRRLAALMKPGGLFFASSPNIAHHRVVRSLLRGQFDLEDQGVMDRTHLRWFTPTTYAAMFEEAGLTVERIAPLVAPGPRSRLIMRLLPRDRRVLFWRQINLRARKSDTNT